MRELERTLLNELLKHVRTREELDHLRQGIERLEEALYRRHSQSFENIMRGELPEGVARHLEEIFSHPPYAENRSSQEALLAELKKSLKWVKYIKIEFAFEPTELLVEKVSEWVRQEVGENIVLDISADLAMLGGARLSYGGKYDEYSLVRLIERALVQKQDEILGLLNPSPKKIS